MDYRDVGFMCGLEVHQQLLTERKMFCHCPRRRYTETHDGKVLRHMRPTLSELGEYDGTALMEFKTKKNIIYLLHKENVCTYEMDDTPPFLVNQQAVDIAIEQCLMLGCDIVDEVHIARKQYLDGSIPTGFQRTAIVGVNGRLPFRGRTLSITQVSVEEDSCREVSDQGHLIVWRTDRLGMPLIETVTGPDLRTPEEVEEAILLVGRVCRSTGHVRVGIGACRQDVNVSVRGGRRVEIKGVPQAGWAPRLVHGEAVRQVNLLAAARRAAPPRLHRAGRLAVEQRRRHRPLRRVASSPCCGARTGSAGSREHGRRPGFELGAGPFCVRAVRLKGLAGTLSWPTQPDHDLRARAGRARARHRRPRPAADPAAQREVARLPRLACRSCGACGRACAAGRTTPSWSSGGRRRTRSPRPRRSACATSTPLDGVPNETRQPFPDGTHRLRADPPGARPDVPRHRQPADAGHPRAGRAAAGGARGAALGAGGALRARPACRARPSTT